MIYKGMTNLFYVPDSLILLKYANDMPGMDLTEMHKETLLSLPHILKIYHLAEEKGFLEVKREKYHVRLHITEKGKKLVEATNIIFDVMGVNNENMQSFRTQHGRVKKNGSIPN